MIIITYYSLSWLLIVATCPTPRTPAREIVIIELLIQLSVSRASCDKQSSRKVRPKMANNEENRVDTTLAWALLGLTHISYELLHCTQQLCSHIILGPYAKSGDNKSLMSLTNEKKNLA